MTIFEMRNPLYQKKYAEAIVGMAYNEVLTKKLLEINNGQRELLSDVIIKKWQPQLLETFDEYFKLTESQENREALQLVKDEWLHERFVEDVASLVTTDGEIVLAHGDGQENNILVMKRDPRKILLIDFEYVGFASKSWDLANYINETMFDNAHPYSPWTEWYPENMLEESEIINLVRVYIEALKNAGVDLGDT